MKLVKGGQGHTSEEVKDSGYVIFYSFIFAILLIFLCGCSMNKLTPEENLRKLNGSR